MKQALRVDIATGDIITPKALQYEYKLLFEEKSVIILSYNLESILAEKLHSIIANSLFNSRMKDYYDIYYLVETKWEEINIHVLKQAVYNTFQNRNKNLSLIKDTYNLIKSNNEIEERFNSYKKAHSYVKDITYQDVMKNLRFLISNITPD